MRDAEGGGDPAAAPSRGHLESGFTNSLRQDSRLYREEVAASIAHVKMLAGQKIIGAKEAERLAEALGEIEREIADGKFQWRDDLEDIHMNIEARLYEKTGDAAGLLHTGRSRNDLVATDTRLYVRRVAGDILDGIRGLQCALVGAAGGHAETLMPAYTHMQRGQPTVLAHHLLAYYEMLKRDAVRFSNALELADELPLGAGAATGSPHPLDRERVARELGFKRVSRNSIDAVSDRDYIADCVYAAALCMTHLSRLAEELVLWSSSEFGFVRLPEKYTTGSSMMPQKRNPDFAELVRGRTGKAYGALVNILATLKGLPLTYNRDMQEDKAPLYDAVDTLLPCLEAMAGMVSGMEVDAGRMRAALDRGAILATDMADYLAKKGMPFREAYLVARGLADRCAAEGRELTEVPLEELKAASSLFDADIKDLTVESSVASRNLVGGTAPEQVRKQLAQAEAELSGG